MDADEREKLEIGKRLRAAREAKRLSMQAAGNAIGVDKSTIQRWELGTLLPRDHWPDVERVYGRPRLLLEFGIDGHVGDPPYAAWPDFLEWYEAAQERHQAQPWMLASLRAIRLPSGQELTLAGYKTIFFAYLAAQEGRDK